MIVPFVAIRLVSSGCGDPTLGLDRLDPGGELVQELGEQLFVAHVGEPAGGEEVGVVDFAAGEVVETLEQVEVVTETDELPENRQRTGLLDGLLRRVHVIAIGLAIGEEGDVDRMLAGAGGGGAAALAEQASLGAASMAETVVVEHLTNRGGVGRTAHALTANGLVDPALVVGQVDFTGHPCVVVEQDHGDTAIVVELGRQREHALHGCLDFATAEAALHAAGEVHDHAHLGGEAGGETTLLQTDCCGIACVLDERHHLGVVTSELANLAQGYCQRITSS